MEGVTTVSNVLNKDLMKRLYAISMFDGHLMMNGRHKNATLVINMLEANADYLDMAVTALESAGIGHHLSRPAIYQKDGYKRQQQLRLQSKAHPTLTKIFNRIYIQKHKVVDPHMLTMMDEEMLAIMFMADGSRSVDKRWEKAKPTYRLHLNSLSYGDLMLIKKSLKAVFNLEINAVKKGSGYDLSVPTKHSEFFELLVDPFVLPSFQYKLGR